MRQVVIIHFPLVDKYVNCGRGNVNKHCACSVCYDIPIRSHLKKKKGKKLSKKIKIMSKAPK